MKKTYCDRCGKEIENEDDEDTKFNKIWNNFTKEDETDKLELCADCEDLYDTLTQKFIKEGKINKSSKPKKGFSWSWLA